MVAGYLDTAPHATLRHPFCKFREAVGKVFVLHVAAKKTAL
jgi:hypothetical protein